MPANPLSKISSLCISQWVLKVCLAIVESKVILQRLFVSNRVHGWSISGFYAKSLSRHGSKPICKDLPIYVAYRSWSFLSRWKGRWTSDGFFGKQLRSYRGWCSGNWLEAIWHDLVHEEAYHQLCQWYTPSLPSKFDDGRHKWLLLSTRRTQTRDWTDWVIECRRKRTDHFLWVRTHLRRRHFNQPWGKKRRLLGGSRGKRETCQSGWLIFGRLCLQK